MYTRHYEWHGACMGRSRVDTFVDTIFNFWLVSIYALK